jgi:hypothetical protein
VWGGKSFVWGGAGFMPAGRDHQSIAPNAAAG